MATYRFEPSLEGLADAGDDELMVAALAAVSLYLLEEARGSRDDTKENSVRWSRAGRLEAQGVAVSPERLTGGWRVGR